MIIDFLSSQSPSSIIVKLDLITLSSSLVLRMKVPITTPEWGSRCFQLRPTEERCVVYINAYIIDVNRSRIHREKCVIIVANQFELHTFGRKNPLNKCLAAWLS